MSPKFKVEGLQNIKDLPIAKDLRDKAKWLEGITDLLADCEYFVAEAKEFKEKRQYQLAAQRYFNAANYYNALRKHLGSGKIIDFAEEFGLERLTSVYREFIGCLANLRLDRNQFFFGIGPLGRSLKLLNPIEISYKELTQLIKKN